MINQLKNKEKATKNQRRRIKKVNYNEVGITLVALVVTIIVLLILAGITMYFVLGQNGLLNRAQHASNTWANATADEDKMMGQFSNDVVSLTAGFIGNEGQGQGEDDDCDGISVEWREILGRATKHPDQSVLNDDIGVGTDGNPVNLDIWYYQSYDDGIMLNAGSASNGDVGYDFDTINNGEIQGKIPQYIKLAGESKFLPVVSLSNTFSWSNLRIPPEIPDTVIDMGSTFDECKYLELAPEIPEGVTDLSFTFCGCSILEVAPEIPDTVIDMSSTFLGCSSLATPPPVIPSSVSELYSTFEECYALTGEMAINATNVSWYSSCFKNAATNQNCDLILSGTCPVLNTLLNTKSNSSKIRIAQ